MTNLDEMMRIIIKWQFLTCKCTKYINYLFTSNTSLHCWAVTNDMQSMFFSVWWVFFSTYYCS